MILLNDVPAHLIYIRLHLRGINFFRHQLCQRLIVNIGTGVSSKSLGHIVAAVILFQDLQQLVVIRENGFFFTLGGRHFRRSFRSLFFRQFHVSARAQSGFFRCVLRAFLTCCRGSRCFFFSRGRISDRNMISGIIKVTDGIRVVIAGEAHQLERVQHILYTDRFLQDIEVLFCIKLVQIRAESRIAVDEDLHIMRKVCRDLCERIGTVFGSQFLLCDRIVGFLIVIHGISVLGIDAFHIALLYVKGIRQIFGRVQIIAQHPGVTRVQQCARVELFIGTDGSPFFIFRSIFQDQLYIVKARGCFGNILAILAVRDQSEAVNLITDIMLTVKHIIRMADNKIRQLIQGLYLVQVCQKYGRFLHTFGVGLLTGRDGSDFPHDPGGVTCIALIIDQGRISLKIERIGFGKLTDRNAVGIKPFFGIFQKFFIDIIVKVICRGRFLRHDRIIAKIKRSVQPGRSVIIHYGIGIFLLGIFLGKRFQHRSFIPGLSFRGFRFFCLDLCCIRIRSRGRLRSTGSGCVSGRSRGRAAGKDHGSRQ